MAYTPGGGGPGGKVVAVTFGGFPAKSAYASPVCPLCAVVCRVGANGKEDHLSD
jgi:hypothetical protein